MTHALKSKLHSNGVAIVPEIPTIVNTPEQAQGQWWTRYDITLVFNESYDYTEDVGTIEHINTTVSIARSPDPATPDKHRATHDMFNTNR